MADMKFYRHVSVAVFAAMIFPSFTLAGNEDSLGRQAEKEGRLKQALMHYVEALKTDVSNQQLREKIIKLAKKIQPPPVVPEEARRHMVRGRAAVKAAKNKQGFQNAADEFKQALYIAPWLVDGYYNLGIMQDKAGKYKEAVRNLKTYLSGAPNSADTREVQDFIYEIEYRRDEAERIKKEERKKAETKEAEARSLNDCNGVWRHYMGHGKKDWQVTISGTKFTCRCLQYVSNTGESWGCASFNVPYEYCGNVNGRKLSGSWNTHPVLPPGQKMTNEWISKNLSPKVLNMKAYLSSDGKELEIQFFQHGILNGEQWTEGNWKKEVWVRMK
jgi:tetratricopeptide (TPR) repeat protein